MSRRPLRWHRRGWSLIKVGFEGRCVREKFQDIMYRGNCANSSIKRRARYDVPLCTYTLRNGAVSREKVSCWIHAPNWLSEWRDTLVKWNMCNCSLFNYVIRAYDNLFYSLGVLIVEITIIFNIILIVHNINNEFATISHLLYIS